MFDDIEIRIIYSNADAGGREIIKKMRQTSFHVSKHPRYGFLSLMSVADLMIGNHQWHKRAALNSQ